MPSSIGRSISSVMNPWDSQKEQSAHTYFPTSAHRSPSLEQHTSLPLAQMHPHGIGSSIKARQTTLQPQIDISLRGKQPALPPQPSPSPHEAGVSNKGKQTTFAHQDHLSPPEASNSKKGKEPALPPPHDPPSPIQVFISAPKPALKTPMYSPPYFPQAPTHTFPASCPYRQCPTTASTPSRTTRPTPTQN